jgi:hypothetical protein
MEPWTGWVGLCRAANQLPTPCECRCRKGTSPQRRRRAPTMMAIATVAPVSVNLGYINALQHELDVLRADARRAFTVSAGHA